MISSRNNPATQNDLDIAPQPVNGYVNSLTLKIGEAYELAFGNNFSKATIKVSSQLLSQPASVKIFDGGGRLLASEQTEPSAVQPGEYRFADQTKSYTVGLEPDYTIEVSSLEAYFVSSLSGKVATSYAPSSPSETYTVMRFGLRKSSWSVQQGETEMYNLMRDYFVSALREYQAELPANVLDNKNLETTNKAQAVIAYYQLRATDQAQFADFIEHLKRGGSPRITYFGKNTYQLGDKVNFADLVSVEDNEDGEIKQIDVRTSANFNRAGTYDVTYSVTDSDGNRTTLTMRVAIVDDNQDVAQGTVSSDNGNAQQTWGSLGSLLPNSIANVSGSTPEANEETTTDGEISQDEVVAPIAVEAPANQTDSSQESEPEAEEKETKSGIGFWQVVFGVAVVLIILGLIRFISDHYVR